MQMTSDLSPYLDYSRSSKAPLYGLPAYVGSIFEIQKKLPGIIEKVSKEFQEKIRKDAEPTWGDVAETIFVAFDSGEQTLRVFSTHPDAHRLEYGDIETPPQPILRKFAYSAQNAFANRVSDLIEEMHR